MNSTQTDQLKGDILIVDDTLPNLQVLSATSGAAGLELARTHSPDLVLLDIMMDEMDGWEVLQTIKSDPELCDTPVVMLTARHNLEDEEETAAYADQFSGYIVKPFVVRELVDEVKRVLSSQGRRNGAE